VTVIMNFVSAFSALLGILCARAIISWRNAYLQNKQEPFGQHPFASNSMFKYPPLLPHENAALVAINYMGQHNHMVMNTLLLLHQKLIDEFILDPAEKQKSDKSDNYEILCKDEFIDDVKKLMNAHSEKTVKEMAIWGTENAPKFNLVLNQVSIETDYSGDTDHPTDILVVFHVKGEGDNALRFQSEASRYLRELVSQSDQPSLRLLRPDVRWK